MSNFHVFIHITGQIVHCRIFIDEGKSFNLIVIGQISITVTLIVLMSPTSISPMISFLTNLYHFSEATTMLSDMDELPFIRLGDNILRFELDPLTPFGKEVALKELRETPEVKAAALVELRNLLQGR